MATTEKELVKVETENERLRNRLRNVNRSSAERGQHLVRKAVIATTGYSLSAFDLDETLSVGGLDGKTVLAAIGFVAPEFVDGDLGRALDAAGDAALAIRAYELGEEHADAAGGGGGGGGGG